MFGQCTLVGVSSVDVMRGACVWSVHACRRLQCRLVAWHCAWFLVAASPHSLSQFFLHVVQSALGGTLVNSLLRFTVCCTDIGLSGITKTKAISKFMVPNKGANEYLVKAVVDFMSGCGCGRAILKRDGEPATVALQEA